MTDTSASAAVKVAVEPMSAFIAFTDEIDSWWVRGPINFFDASRAAAMRIEPGVGGRVLEVYDEASGEALELGRITVWEPGVQLAYRSSVDDTEVDVRFEAVEGGTSVRVTQTLPPGGERAFFFWPNVLRWLVPWCDERDGARPARREIARLSIALQDVPVTHMPWVYVDDLDSHFAHAKGAGAAILSEIQQQGYRAYTAEDLEGRRWTFVQARPTMA